MKTSNNYTQEQIDRMVAVYTGKTEEGHVVMCNDDRQAAVESLAKEFGRSVASVRAKLVNLGVYVKAERLTKNGKKVESKANVVEEIAKLCDMESEFFDSLEKANKAVLVVLRSKLENFAEICED